MLKIAPSILAADFGKMAEEVASLEKCGADIIHCDVMDGVFVPNITFGMPMIKAVRKASGLPLDVHLMIINPEKYIDEFIDAGADCISFHVAATQKTDDILNNIKKRGIKSGIAINPDIPLESVKRYIEKIDMLLIMSVYAGFGGQKFIFESIKKIENAAELKKKYNKNLLIEVDGGINTQNVWDVAAAGADIAVAGSCVFGAADREACIATLKGRQ
ncbi:MAG: ribulose-phosphate 3-epimerase [Clostridiales bacterium]|jgi:ribulose-phosphate 3-epimerase|nr:ribulose-phosphate 3-epimerase [Clostridiales bacterium]